MARLLCYALGGGLGHLTRQLGLARAAVARGHVVTVLCSGPLALHVARQVAWQGVRVEHVEAANAGALGRRVRERLGRADFDACIVDTFPRGLAGELADWLPRAGVPAVLVHRILDPEYARRPVVQAALDHYAAILLPGELGPYAEHPRALATEPWVVLPPGEILPRAAARAVLGATACERVVVIVASGIPAEIRATLALARALRRHVADGTALRVVAPGDGHPWPLLRYLAGVDLLVGSGGYNTVHEARATGTPLLALARRRRYDLQRGRLAPHEHAESRKELVARVAAWSRAPAPRPPPIAAGGSGHAVRHIESLLA